MRKSQKTIYWVSTVVLVFGLLSSGIQQVLMLDVEGAVAPPFVWGIEKLGYPVYLLTLIGIWKILGAIALLIPKYPLLKEWAYAGIFFLFTGALFSHVAADHSLAELVPATTLLTMALLSWFLRPSDRKVY